MTTEPTYPPMEESNEATRDELRVAREQGDAYGHAIGAMADEDGAATARAGDYLVALVNEEAEGMYMLDDGVLVWREAAPDANVHLEVAVADAGDGRFVPGLRVHVDVERAGKPILTNVELPFLWHPFLYHYGGNAKVPDAGPFEVTVRIAAPTFMRHDPVNGKRYDSRVDVRFENVTFANGRKESPEASPRGADAPTAG
ncbi:iron transporter [Asanoa sp. WMMD1127]|uniref:iron transporter n=1 Tax=Asanoa sp. WMMD1127 TaxID=3016107 RepID=UPI002417A5B2|nr:iron transporter [Asanoa sp. WMMD1127]MDG4824826.1 iron transporter [Asanoa sp. WMMD1127]